MHTNITKSVADLIYLFPGKNAKKIRIIQELFPKSCGIFL